MEATISRSPPVPLQIKIEGFFKFLGNVGVERFDGGRFFRHLAFTLSLCADANFWPLMSADEAYYVPAVS